MAKVLVSRRNAVFASLALGVGPRVAEAQPLAQSSPKQGSREMDSSNKRLPMARFVILWNKPKDVDAFDRHYREVHIPLAKKMAGLRRYTLSRNASAVRGGEPYYRIAELDWDDMASLQHALFESPEGRATGADMAILTELSTGVHSMIYELEDV
jgi:uncharacterized protein (TIGR02118 family)